MPATDPVQAVAEAMCPTHREDVPIPLPDHHDPRLRYAACYDCALKAEAAVAAVRPLIAAQALREAGDWLDSFEGPGGRQSAHDRAGRDVIRLLRARADDLEAGRGITYERLEGE